MDVIKRRDVLRILLATAAMPSAIAAAASKRGAMPKPEAARMPVIFLAHGAPVLTDDAKWVGELNGWATTLPRPNAILMVSAHWTDEPLRIGATRTVPLVYDFYNFPERFYQVKYPAPGAPDLAERVRELLAARGLPFADDPARGLDHGAYVPLLCMYPRADVPVLQVSMPGLDPATLLAFGQAMAPLRREGVLIIGSGFLTHNLRLGPMASTPSWALEFDAWAADALARRDIDALLDFRARAPGVKMALPTYEHFAPVIVAAGAIAGEEARVSFPITGFWFGTFTRRSVQFG